MHLTLVRGTALVQGFVVKAPIGPDGALKEVDLSTPSLALVWSAKDAAAPDMPSPRLSKSLGAGIVRGSGVGKAILTLDAADTAKWVNEYRQLGWELRVTVPGSGTYSADAGDLEVFPSPAF